LTVFIELTNLDLAKQAMTVWEKASGPEVD
jgi:hypothetical protein